MITYAYKEIKWKKRKSDLESSDDETKTRVLRWGFTNPPTTTEKELEILVTIESVGLWVLALGPSNRTLGSDSDKIKIKRV